MVNGQAASCDLSGRPKSSPAGGRICAAYRDLKASEAGAGSMPCGIIRHCGRGARAMTDEQLEDIHRFLAEYHRRLAEEAVLDVVQQYHADLAQRLADEAALIPRRTAIVSACTNGSSKKGTMASEPPRSVPA